MQFQHDCDQCKFLGSGKYLGEPVDYWYHPRAEGSELIARLSSDGPDYVCTPLPTILQYNFPDKWDEALFLLDKFLEVA